MFTAKNYNIDGVFYDYRALNEILASMLVGSEDPQHDEAKFAEKISQGITERDSVLYYGGKVVGGILDALDDA